MKTIHLLIYTVVLIFAIQSSAVAQSFNVTETFKQHFNKTVQEIQHTENADEKRAILNDSFSKMIAAIERMESLADLSKDEKAQLNIYKMGIAEKQNELNGLDGFDEIMDEDLDDFSNFSQQFMEQANRTITIGVGTAVVILLILLLLI